MHVYDDGSIVNDVVVKVLKIVLRVSKFFYSLQQLLFFTKMQFLTFVMHIIHGFVLKRSATIKSRILFIVKKF